MYEIKQSTAETILFFVHDSAGDAVLSLTDGSFTKRISKGSGAWGAMTVTITEGENGWYSMPLSTSHSDTTGLLSITFTNAGAKQVNLQWRVEARLVDDLNNAITAPTAVQNRTEMDSNSTQLAAIVADTNELQADDVPGLIATVTTDLDDIKGTGFVKDTHSLFDIEGYVDILDDGTSGNAKIATDVAAVLVDTADMQPKLGSPASSVSADIAAVKVDTASILVDTGTTLPALIDDLAVKKNATFSNFEFLMVLTSDHATPATGLTVTGQRSIDGAGFATVTGTIAEVSNGIYQFDAVAADTNGDFITWRFSSATADDTFVSFKTVA